MSEGRGLVRKVAAERMEILYSAAVKAYPEDAKLSKERIKLILEIGRHYKAKIPVEMAVHICKRCCLPLIEGRNLEVRVIASQGRSIYRCRVCGSVSSMAFGKVEKKAAPSGRKRRT